MVEPLVPAPVSTALGSRTRVLLAAATLLSFLLPLAVYLPTPGDYWIRYDNELLIRNEPIVETLALPGPERLAGLAEMFTTAHGDLYQPLLSFSLAIDYALFGWDRAGWHAHSLLLHMAITAGAFLLAYRLVGVWWAALLATLFASLHPVVVEPVSWIIHRTILVTTAWILVGSHAYLSYARDPRRWGWLAVATLAFGASCMAKSIPSVVALPILFDLWLFRRGVLRLVLEKLPLAALVACFTGLSLAFSREQAGEQDLAPVVPAVLDALSNATAGLGLSVANTLAPAHLALFYPADATWEILGSRVLLAGAATLGVLVAGGMLWQRGQRGLLLSAAAWLAMVAPFIAAASLFRDTITADRYLYAALLVAAPGIAQTLAWLSATAPAIGRIALVLFVAWTATLAGQARLQARHWTDEVTLWNAALANAAHPVAYGALGRALIERGELGAAVEAYRHALELVEGEHAALAAPIYYTSASRLGIMAAQQKMSASSAADDVRQAYLAFALDAASRGADRWPELEQLEFERGRALALAGDRVAAIAAFERVVERRPEHGPALVELGVALDQSGNRDRAAEILERAVAQQQTDPRILEALGPIYESRSQLGQAVKVTFLWVMATRASSESRARFLSIARRGLASPEREEIRVWLQHYVDAVPEPGLARELLENDLLSRPR